MLYCFYMTFINIESFVFLNARLRTRFRLKCVSNSITVIVRCVYTCIINAPQSLLGRHYRPACVNMLKKTKLKDPNEIIRNFNNVPRTFQLELSFSRQFLEFYR